MMFSLIFWYVFMCVVFAECVLSENAIWTTTAAAGRGSLMTGVANSSMQRVAATDGMCEALLRHLRPDFGLPQVPHLRHRRECGPRLRHRRLRRDHCQEGPRLHRRPPGFCHQGHHPRKQRRNSSESRQTLPRRPLLPLRCLQRKNLSRRPL